MAPTLTPEGENAVGDIARRHSLSREAVLAMLVAVHNGGGTMAQFNVPELGGSGQWMRGGMTMVGDMFDNALKARVDALCAELAQLLASTTVFPAPPSRHQSGAVPSSSNSAAWWPADLGAPSSTGAQNNARYAIFPSSRRLVIQVDGLTRIFDTGEHRIGGVQQQQGGGYATVGFTSQLGTFSVATLQEIGASQTAHDPHAENAAAPPHQTEPAPALKASTPPSGPADAAASEGSSDPATIVAAIESLAGLHQRGILSDEEFAAKKAELLARL